MLVLIFLAGQHAPTACMTLRMTLRMTLTLQGETWRNQVKLKIKLIFFKTIHLQAQPPNNKKLTKTG